MLTHHPSYSSAVDEGPPGFGDGLADAPRSCFIDGVDSWRGRAAVVNKTYGIRPGRDRCDGVRCIDVSVMSSSDETIGRDLQYADGCGRHDATVRVEVTLGEIRSMFGAAEQWCSRCGLIFIGPCTSRVKKREAEEALRFYDYHRWHSIGRFRCC